MKTAFSLLCLAALLLGLSACGKKASEVVLSDHGPLDAYPRTYPDISTDPAPGKAP